MATCTARLVEMMGNKKKGDDHDNAFAPVRMPGHSAVARSIISIAALDPELDA